MSCHLLPYAMRPFVPKKREPGPVHKSFQYGVIHVFKHGLWLRRDLHDFLRDA